MTESHETDERPGFRLAESVEDAHALHHLATADPEPERDGMLTGPAHEEKYGLDRAERSAEEWRAAGLDPINNGPLDAPETEPVVETTKAKSANETTTPPKASK